jgi:hypothetical protein
MTTDKGVNTGSAESSTRGSNGSTRNASRTRAVTECTRCVCIAALKGVEE